MPSTYQSSAARASRPAPVIMTLPTSTGVSLAMITLRRTVASPARTRPATIRRLKPWPYASSSSVAPCGLLASSSKARRCSELRRRFRGADAIRNHDPSFRRNRPPRTCLRDLLYEPPPLRFPDDHLAIDATDDRVLDHGVIVAGPIPRVPAFDAGLALDLRMMRVIPNRQGTRARGSHRGTNIALSG